MSLDALDFAFMSPEEIFLVREAEKKLREATADVLSSQPKEGSQKTNNQKTNVQKNPRIREPGSHLDISLL